MTGYLADSTLVDGPDGTRLDLATALGRLTPEGSSTTRRSSKGSRSGRTSLPLGLLAVADVADGPVRRRRAWPSDSRTSTPS